jgi:hypothetical protein
MKEISNNLLAALLIAAIAISGFGVLTISNYITQQPTKIMGAATGTGKVNLSISEAVEIVLLRNESLFGAGFPNIGGGGIVNIESNKTDNCGTAGATCFYNGSEGNGTEYGTGTHVYPFVARVEGNDESTCLRVEAASTAASFIGGAAQTPTFKFGGKDNESISCYGTLTTAWSDVGISWTTICDTTNHTDANDEVRIHWQLGIPTDAAGTKSNTITVCAAGTCGTC